MFFIKISIPNFISKLLYHISRRLSIIYFLYLLKDIYSPYKDVEHYEYNVDISGNTLTSTTKIDYSKIDTDQLIEIDSANGTLIKDGKINIEDIRSAYESVGATCE